jgi:head-tail adaptor
MKQSLWPTLNPGKLRTPITLLEQVLGSDASGATVSYAPATPPIAIMGDVEYLRGGDALKGGQEVTQTVLQITSWYRPEFAAQKRIQAPSGQYIILNVNNVREMNVVMILTCLGLGASN